MNDILKSYQKQKFLMHAGERKNHKYIARVKTKNSNRWRYFYSRKEYDNWLAGNKKSIDVTIEDYLNDIGGVTKSTVKNYDQSGNVINRKETMFNTNSSGVRDAKVEVNTVYDRKNYVYGTTTTIYTRNRGQNFIEKVLGLNKKS